MATVTVVLPPEYEPFKHLFECAIHDELSHILGSGMYSKHMVARDTIINTDVLVTVQTPTAVATSHDQEATHG
jgi:hypothetical protein